MARLRFYFGFLRVSFLDVGVSKSCLDSFWLAYAFALLALLIVKGRFISLFLNEGFDLML